jgi:hypothetical protein
MKGHPMKNKIISIIILMALILAACSTASTANQSATTTNTRSFAGQAELIVGIFKLEGTDQAVTVKQASELLPLWEAMKVLANSNTSAQAEIDATVRQIKEALTPNQLQAITAMNLTEQDVSVFEQSLNTNTVQTSSKSGSSQSSGGFGPGGGPGSDSLGRVLTGTSQSQSSATSTTSAKALSGTSSQVSTALIDALIKLLEKRANA